MCSLKCEDISSYGQRKNIFFLKNCTIGMVWMFLDNYLFIRRVNCKKNSVNLAKNFLREKAVHFFCVKSIYTPFDS